jgi:nitroimidazol reductase NimA-like FMN-containing flavoprotein (pyridoxamine 5'-phosphate oxidase superfamily)
VRTRLPAVPRRGDAGVPARLAAIDRTRRHAAFATDAGGAPYLSLVAFALAQDGAAVLFATPRDSRKFRNLRANPRVSLLLDTRGERDRDYASAEAITVVGRARVLRAGSSAWREAGQTLHAKHPALAAFLEATTTALVRVEIEEAVHVGGFQRVTTWRPGP